MPVNTRAPLASTRIKEAEFLRKMYVADCDIGTRPEDLLDPAYWAHVSVRFKPMDRIEARAADGTWLAELVVLESSRTWARCHMLSCHNLTSTDVSMSQATTAEAKGDAEPVYEVVHRGPRKWSVVRRSDREVMHEGEARREGAEAWIATNGAKAAATT